MTSLKPYLIRSIYEWIIDNSLTPHLLVDAENAGAILPTEFIEDGKIILNIRPEAIQGLSLGNEEIEFNARFSGKPMHIVTPVTAVLAIYAKENGKGMIFDPEDNEDDEPPPVKKPTSKPNLRIVK
ncbi:stringent starvation protein B [Methylobacter tundripaludum]|uniref:Stringent starvation protein B n=1 Tax=Methylobacter tundripaludum TaxID=173365 RepID=A0A2S6GP00_9GAMM|nr:ClpXP protease specificity-enhancing factor [Methylobacter tundripaludum]PPK66937.1 stringent starvation protein B [Methylobacter tundripaludum]